MLKSIARLLFPKDLWDKLVWYRNWYAKRFGLFSALRSLCLLLFRKENLVGVQYPPFFKKTILMRTDIVDQQVYDEIFITKEYDVEIDDPRIIVDAGAHIGMSSLFFAERFPKAKVLAIEPEEHNFSLLVRNTEDTKNIYPINAGLWGHNAILSVQNPQTNSWGFRLKETEQAQGIPTLTIDDIILSHNVRFLDILKIDIEGAEIEVFENSASWINNVRLIIIELHDSFRPGCTEALENSIKNYHFSKYRIGEKTVLRRTLNLQNSVR
jgi:FkbM family methyltransferase